MTTAQDLLITDDMNSFTSDRSGSTVTHEHLEELKRLLAAASSSSAPDALRPVLEYAQRLHSSEANQGRLGAQA